MKLMKSTALVAVMSAAAVSAQANSLGEVLSKVGVEIPENNCLWVGPYVKENPETNFAYPDTGAKYWSANFAMPEGSKLEFYGRYMHNRYMSYNSYDAAGDNPTFAPVDAIADIDLNPLFRFARNPYVEGNLRNTPLRGYRIEVLPGAPVEGDPDNTLRSNADYNERSTIVLRSYVEDEGTGSTAGEYLPAPVLTLADGRVLTDVEEVCGALEADSSVIDVPVIPPSTYDQVTAFGNPYKVDATEENPASLLKAFTAPDNINCNWFGFCHPAPSSVPGFYANLDNEYVFANTTNARPVIYPETAIGLPAGTTPLGHVTVGFQKDPSLAVSVFRGKLPVTPKTSDGAKRVAEGDMRYWSFCTNEYMTQKVTDCLYDEQVVVDEDGYFTIAVSWEEDRPENATAECGYNWLPASTRGDGYLDLLESQVDKGRMDASVLTTPNPLGAPRANNPYQNLVIVRNMLPSAGFANAIQNVPNATSVDAVMGEYAVKYHYESKMDFESRGCN